MKKLFIILALAVCFTNVNAQFKTAVLQASGLTCAMCSKAINNSLEKLSSIQSVKADIKNSAFNIVFTPGVSMNIDQLKKAVQDAGFSIAKLKLTGDFVNVAVKNDEHVQINGATFHFLNISNQTLNGNREITIVDKNFLTAREFKKFSGATQMSCLQTGKAEACCKKEGFAENSRIYHATI
ncbi:MAG: heavy-metal-associated domain-containing protein [Chitinophagaceae bacterium]